MDNLAVIVPFFVAIVAPVGAYLLAARKMSGKVATSDASDLWAESRSIRDDYRSRILWLEERVVVLEEGNATLVKEALGCQSKILALETLVAQLRATIAEQKEELDL